ncbi:MAG: arginase family protein [Bacteroidales bacterium]
MINLSDYFDPVSIEKPLWSHLAEPSTLAHNLTISTASNPVTDISDYRLVIIGVPDDRWSPNKGTGEAPDAIRESLYQLSRLPGKIKIADLGNLKKGPTFEDTLAGLKDILSLLSGNSTTALLIGGSSAVIPAIGKVMTTIRPGYTYTAIDSRLDFVNERREQDSFNYLGNMVHGKSTGLENFIQVGYQSHLNDPQVINRFRKLNFELVRIGEEIGNG